MLRINYDVVVPVKLVISIAPKPRAIEVCHHTVFPTFTKVNDFVVMNSIIGCDAWTVLPGVAVLVNYANSIAKFGADLDDTR